MDEWRQMDERLLSAFQKTVGSNIYMAKKTFSCLYKSCQRFIGLNGDMIQKTFSYAFISYASVKSKRAPPPVKPLPGGGAFEIKDLEVLRSPIT